MARARNIKPGFFANEELVELPFHTRLLFIGLWTLCDRAGRMEDKPKRIKMALFPADNIDIFEALSSLEQSGFLLRYECNGERYIQVLAFDKHQNPHKDEKASTIPAPCSGGVDTLAIGLIPDSLIPDSLIPDSKTTSGYSPEFEEAWLAYPRKGDTNKSASNKAWSARVKAGVDPKVMIDGVRRYAAYCKAMKTEQTYIKQPQTFFGPDRHFDGDWMATSPPSKSGHTFSGTNYREGVNEDGSFD